jgi:hypothetical protein
MAYDRIAFVRAGRIPMVLALAVAICALHHDAAHHHLDGQHHPDILRLAPAHAWSSVDGSRLDYAAGIRIRGHCGRNYLFAPLPTSGSNPAFNPLSALRIRATRLPPSVFIWTSKRDTTIGVIISGEPSNGSEWLAWAQGSVLTCPRVSRSFCLASDTASVQFH